MKRIWYFIFATIAAMASGCHDEEPGPDRMRLLRAEYFIDTWQLDSADAAMDSLKGRHLSCREDSALYALNLMRLTKTTNRHMPDDDMAATATSFYDGSGQTRRAMLAWYYRACLLFDSRHYMESMSAISRMKPYAEQLNDYLYLSRFGDMMGHCHEISDNNREAARYYSYSFRQFLENEPDNAGYLKYFSILATKAWLRAGHIDSALAISSTMKPVVLAQRDTNIVSTWLSSHATMLLDERIQDCKGAAALYDEMDSLHAPYWPGAPNHRIAKLLIKSGMENDTSAWNAAMRLIDKHGVESLSFGYMFHGSTAPDQLEMHADIYIDPAMVLPSIKQDTTDNAPESAEAEDNVADSPVTHVILGVLLGVLTLAVLVILRRRRK